MGMVTASDAMDNCIEYSRRNDKDGYGIVRFMGRDWKVHRLAYLWSTGEEHGPLLVMHTCDNPPCFNPLHLRLGTQKDNQRDKWQKNRGVRHVNNKFKATITQEMADQIRRLYKRGQKPTQADIGVMFGIQGKAVSKIVTNIRWRKES